MFLQPLWRLLVAAALSLGLVVPTLAQYELPEPTVFLYVKPQWKSEV